MNTCPHEQPLTQTALRLEDRNNRTWLRRKNLLCKPASVALMRPYLDAKICCILPLCALFWGCGPQSSRSEPMHWDFLQCATAESFTSKGGGVLDFILLVLDCSSIKLGDGLASLSLSLAFLDWRFSISLSNNLSNGFATLFCSICELTMVRFSFPPVLHTWWKQKKLSVKIMDRELINSAQQNPPSWLACLILCSMHNAFLCVQKIQNIVSRNSNETVCLSRCTVNETHFILFYFFYSFYFFL